MISIGAKLKELARSLDLADAEVARRLDIDPSRYGHYVSGTRQPDYDMLVRICKVLGTTPNELLGFEPLGKGRGMKASDSLLNRGMTALAAISPEYLDIAVRQVECFLKKRKKN